MIDGELTVPFLSLFLDGKTLSVSTLTSVWSNLLTQSSKLEKPIVVRSDSSWHYAVRLLPGFCMLCIYGICFSYFCVSVVGFFFYRKVPEETIIYVSKILYVNIYTSCVLQKS